MKRIFGGSHKVWMIAIGLVGMYLMSGAIGCFYGCFGFGQYNSYSPSMSYTTVTVTAILEPVSPQTAYQPGTVRQTRLKANLNTSQNVAFVWNPPTGATNFTFPASFTPAAGGPPYNFQNITSTQAANGFLVSYNLPTSGTTASEGLTVIQMVSGQTYRGEATVQYTLSAMGGTAVDLKPLGDSARTQSSVPPMVWEVMQSNDFTVPLTALYCQNLVSQAQSANIFAALRAPVADAIQDNVSYGSPISFGGYSVPQTTLSADGLNVNMPMILRPEMTAWSNAHLPSATGELWTALAIDPEADLTHACDNATGQPKFSLSTFMELDLSNRPNNCIGCTVSTYLCYKTGLMPGIVARWLTFGRDSLSVGEYTCLGPDETVFNDFGNWTLTDYTASQVLKPGDPILLHYWVTNNDYENPHTFHIGTINSSLAVTDWAVHPSVVGDPTTPDLAHTITGDFSVVKGSQYELYITGTVPAGAAANNYPFHLTVTSTEITPASLIGGSILTVTASGDLPPVADTVPHVSLTGVAAPGAAHRGEQVTYTFTIHNDGATVLTGLAVQDTLPANTTYVGCTGADSCGLNSGVISWNLASLGTSQEVILTLTIRINANTPPATTVIHNSTYSVNTTEGATASGSTIDVAVSPYRVHLPILSK